jgi:hypothetical protein
MSAAERTAARSWPRIPAGDRTAHSPGEGLT